MWTPKRILLVVGGFVLFFAGYVVYTYFLGNINGWPPLPDTHTWENRVKEYEELPKEPRESPIDQKLQMALGEGCEEIGRPIRLEVPGRGIVLASDEVSFEPDGRVKLRPFSLALFGKDRGDASYPEINTVRSEVAYLRFDQPIASITDMGNRKIIGAELTAPVTIINNRRSPQKSDDIEVRITAGPLFYEEKTNKVWSDGFVKLLDTQSQPDPTDITAKGMELYLVKETRPATPLKAGAKPETVTGVERVVLLSNVEMHLHMASESGFLGGGPEKSEKKAEPLASKGDPKKAAPPAHIIIKTEGQFVYDMQKDTADFESPPPSTNPNARLAPPQVLVTREHIQPEGGKLYDQLTCDHLRLQFRRKTAADPKAPRDNSIGNDREIESAHATARPDKDVVLSMDSEHLDAHSTELIYYSATATKGPETILRGQPMHAAKDAHKIEALELHLIGANAKNEGQQMTAKGPGKIDLVDHNSDPKVPTYPYHTTWRDTLLVTKDREGERIFDLLTFTGDAAFIDDEHGQELRAERLQLWLEPPERQETVEVEQQKNKQSTAPEAPKQRPHKLEGFEHVTSRSPEMKIHEAEHLIVRFKNVPVLDKLPEKLPAAANGGVTTEPGPNANPSDPPSPAPGTLPPAVSPGPNGAVAAETEKKDKERKPINLRARSISAVVLRCGDKNELEEVITEGSTYVHQDGSTPQDKGVDIQGETLKLQHFAQGDILTVWGDSRAPAQLQLGELFLVGPTVRINQKDNTADVVGVGAMHMPSNTTFDGEAPKKPGTRLTVHWTKDMFFNGKDADFHGGVVAYQENASVRCQSMQVSLDKVVSFKEGQKSGQGAKVEKLVCDRKVYIADCVRDDSGGLLRYQRLIALELSMDNQEGPVIASGPGKLYVFQPGSVETLDPKGPPQPANPIKPAQADASTPAPLYLTRVDFQKRMFSNNKEKTRTAKFYENVEVYHLPADNPDIKLDPDHLPKGGIYIRCEQMTVYSKPLPDGRTAQFMRGEQNVSFRTPEFHGTCIMVTYNQQQDQVIFHGVSGSPVRLFRINPVRQGSEPDMITGYRIEYDRKTGTMKVDHGREFRFSSQ